MSKRKTDLGTARTQQLAEWLKLGLLKSGKKKGALAALLNLPPSAISKILSAQREVREYELRIIADYIEEPIPDALWETPPTGVVHVMPNPVWLQPSVIIAPGVWRSLEADVMRPERIPASTDPRLDGIEQYACYVESDGSCVTCIPYKRFRLTPVAGDTVHVRRLRNEIEAEDTIRKVVMHNGSPALLTPNSDAEPVSALSHDVEIVGLVVGRYVPERF